MIAVVDDDVGFAEELQDLLMLHGHRAVVVVTHPHASSLMLLGSARLLILDLSLAVTTALGVLEDLAARGRTPAVVIVSGSGSEALEAARRSAVERGFRILGALPKPVAPEQLLDLIAAAWPLPAPAGSPALPIDQPWTTQIVSAGTLEHRGMRLALDTDDPWSIVPRAIGAQRSLSIDGRDGFVVCPLGPDVATAAAIDELCASVQFARQPEAHIVFDLGPHAPWQVAMAAPLHAAGFGIMVHVESTSQMLAAADDLPASILAIEADRLLSEAEVSDPDVVLDTLLAIRSRAILTLCDEVQSVSDLTVARSLGFDLVTNLTPAA